MAKNLLIELISKNKFKYTYFNKNKIVVRIVFFDKLLNNFDGKCKNFYDDGKIKSEYIFVNGKIEGIYKEYYKTGELKKAYHYKNNKLDGTQEEYYKNSVIKCIKIFKDNSLISEENFKNGKSKILKI